MKKLYLIMTAALAAVACSKEYNAPLTPEAPGTEEKTLFAEIIDTKTALSGTKTTWVKNDSIVVIDSTDVLNVFKFSAQSSGTSTTFKGTATEGQDCFGAIYPYVEGVKKFNYRVLEGPVLPIIQEVADGSQLPLMAQYTQGTLEFKPLCAAIKFTLGADYDGKLESVKFSDNAGTLISGLFRFNMETGNVATVGGSKKNASYATYRPASGKIAAGTYYLGFYVAGQDTTKKEFSEGITLTFTTVSGKTVDMRSEKVFTAKRGVIYNFGELKPVLPKEVDYKPYDYPASKATFKSISNIMYYESPVITNASNKSNTLTFSTLENFSVEGATVTTGPVQKAITVGGKSIVEAYFTTNNANWSANDYYIYKTPVSQEIKGDVAFSFSLTCSVADAWPSEWAVQWSKDGEDWSDALAVYSVKRYTPETIKTTYNVSEAGTGATVGTATAKFNVPESKALASGDYFYVRLLTPVAPAKTNKTIRMNFGSVVYPWPENTDFTSDSKVVASNNFSACTNTICTVVGSDLGYLYSATATAVEAYDGWEFSGVNARLGHVDMAGSSATITSPALSSLTAPTDLIVSFKASPARTANGLEVADVSVQVEGAGSVDSVNWTKPLSQSLYNWTVAYCKITGADATTKVKIVKGANTCRFYVDDIVIAK